MAHTETLFDLHEPLSSADLATYEAAFNNLQGNILKSHGREAARHIFLTFKPRSQRRAKQGPSLVLVKDPLADSSDACGTYFVFRKLEQNVK
jgi:deferrochelatase/peroxidase EfeB